MPALDLTEALMAAAQRVVEALGCDKVDAFLFDESKQTLRAVGTSNTPMGRRQRALGLDVIPLANGGRMAETFKSGVSQFDNQLDKDSEELRGIVVELGVRSSITVVLDVAGARRGILSAVSARQDFFTPADLQFLTAVARWVGVLAHRAELVQHARQAEAEQGRRAGADEIITVLAHDLRNHLHPLLGRLQLMRMQASGGRPVEVKDVELALRSVRRLSRLTADLLDLKRLDEGLFNLDLAPVDLVNIASESAATLSTPSVPVQVTGLDALLVIADGERLRQALENLVANAVKYSPAGKRVEIRIGVELCEGDERALVEVIDEGPGISPELLPVLFERFTSSRDSPGLGLGLYLAHRIVRVHRGELRADSKPGAGTTFRLELPLDAACAASPPSIRG
ncbi:MAG: ATP-binding protein [Myxococcota bacterium]